MSAESWSFQKGKKPLLFLCGSSIHSEGIAQKLFEGVRVTAAILEQMYRIPG